jgi:F-type H+-transporting ATPase subunit delta
MAELTTVARPYAEAAFRAALDAKNVAGFGKELMRLGAAVGTREAVSMLGNPRVSSAEKAATLCAVTSGEVPGALRNLVSTLIDNQRATLLPFIVEHFERLQREHEGVLKAVITSAFKMSDVEKQSVVDALAKKYGKKIEAEVRVDESLIGGARVQVGDDVVHASVRDQLDKMAVALAS